MMYRCCDTWTCMADTVAHSLKLSIPRLCDAHDRQILAQFRGADLSPEREDEPEYEECLWCTDEMLDVWEREDRDG